MPPVTTACRAEAAVEGAAESGGIPDIAKGGQADMMSLDVLAPATALFLAAGENIQPQHSWSVLPENNATDPRLLFETGPTVL